MRIAAMTLCMIGWATVARAAPPEPAGPHPRMLLDARLRAAWQERKDGRNPVAGAIALCSSDPKEHAGAQYMGAEWKKMLQACLVAWAATGEPRHAQAALLYFTALIDDLDKIGDGKGGDAAASRDAGYPIRNLGPYTALAYDWLHDAPGMTPELRARARQRWAAWLTWFDAHGYHPHDPGSNYHAGYLIAATMIAIAQAGEAGEPGAALWRTVVDRMWNKEMAAALAPGGVLDGGDWDEGWQYGPLSIAEYALAARVLRPYAPVDGIAGWLAAVLRRHVHALNPSDRLWAGGDYDSPEAYAEPSAATLAAVALGDAGPDDRRWARGELSRLKLTERDSPLFSALAAVGDPPVVPPRASWPTWYRAAGTATIFARTGWDDRAIWFVASCARTSALDHRSPNAGNFVLSRGRADLVVDPSPYGSLSTLTGNAPTVRSRQLPESYQPSQGAWGSGVRWRWTARTASGVVAARCDYRDAYRFQDRPSDVAEALRDFVLLPAADGHDAQLVVIDRATTGDADRHMYLRFRVPGELALDASGAASTTIGDARLTIHGIAAGAAAGAPAAPSGKLAKTALKDCFQPGTPRGNCDAARLPVTDYRSEIAGPAPRAIHVLDATGARGGATSQPISGDGYTGVALAGPRDAVVVWPTAPGTDTDDHDSAVRDHRGDRGDTTVRDHRGGDRAGTLTYRAPRRRAVTHIVLDAPAAAGSAHIAARADGDACIVMVEPARSTDGRTPSADGRTPSADDRTPSADRRTPSADGRTPSADGRAPSADRHRPSPSDGVVAASPLVVTIDEHCAIAADPVTSDGVAAAASTPGAPAAPSPSPATQRSQRAGCCGASAGAAAPAAMSLLVLAVLVPPHRRRSRRPR